MRRFWADSAKRRMVAETLSPGASVSVVARRHDVNANLLFKWKRELGARAGDNRVLPAAPCEFVPIGVVVTGSPATSMPAAGSLEIDRRADSALAWFSRTGVMEIELASGSRVRVDGTVDEQALGRVLQALKCCG